MKIGLATDFYYPWIGGPSILIRTLGEGLAARGHSVSLICPSTSRYPEHGQDGAIEVTRVRTVPTPFGYNLRVAPWPRPEIARWLRRTQPDVLHVHHPFPIGATTILSGRRIGIPVAATNHTIPECSLWGMRTAGVAYDVAQAAFSTWIIYLLDSCNSVATPTRTAADLLRSLGYRGPIESISNGVDVERFQPGEPDLQLRSRLGLDDRPIVLYTGRLDAEKQMDVWLRAAAEVLKSDTAQFVVGGNGAERPRLERLALELGLSSSVRFIGYLSDVEFPELYRLADLFFITSPVELQSISTLEALASGLPVVAVDAGALPEIVADGQNGYLVRAGDWTAASDRIVALLADTQLRAQFGRASRTASLRHDLRQSISTYEEFLHTTAQKAPGARQRGRVPASGS